MQPQDKNLFCFYWHFIKLEKRKFTALLLMPLLWCTAETYAPYLIKILLDKLNTHPENLTYFLIQFSFIYVTLMAVIEGSLRFSSYLCIQIIPKLKESIRTKSLEHLQKYPLHFFQTHLSGDVLTATKNLSDSFEQGVVSFIYGLYSITLTFFISLILIGTVSKLFACLFGAWYLGMNAVTFLFYRPTIQTAEESASSESKLYGFMGDLFRNNLLIKTFLSSDIDQSLLKNLQNEVTQNAKKSEWVTFKADTLRGFLSFLFLSSLFIFLTKNWQKGLITTGDFAFVTTLCFYVRRSTWMGTVQLLTFLKYMGISKHSFRLLFSEDLPEIQLNKNPTEDLAGEIRFELVKFGYGNDKKIYNDFNLYIPARQKIGIIGASGAGKTTLVQLLLKLLNPEAGTIYLDNHSIIELNAEFLKKQISYVSQLVPLFHRSIYENIHYGNPSASFDKVIEASKACLCHQFISRFEEGYNTIIGEDGVKLSGGQRQRLALARAFLKNSSILIFDEATSALYPSTEDKVLDTFLAQNKTTIMITHRTSALHKLDRILMLEDGKIVKEGTPNEVIKSSTV